jgi:pimeloyl-ACP methyl ester carboxylesterase
VTSRRRFLGAGAALSGAGLLTTGAAAARPRSPPGARQHRLYVPGPYGQIHLTITEPLSSRATAPPVVCLPMSPRSGRDFDEFALALADRRRVIAPDVPGFGGSDAPPAPPGIEDYAAAILAGLDTVLDRGARPSGFDLVGQHTGAAIAIAAALQAPARVRHIAAIGVPLFEAAELERLRAQFAKPRPYFADPGFLCSAWERDAAAIKGGLSPERMLLRFTEIMRAGVHSHWGFNAVFNYDMERALARLPRPLLAIVLNENLAAASRRAATLAPRGEAMELADLPGSALDFASQRLAGVCRDYFDRA